MSLFPFLLNKPPLIILGIIMFYWSKLTRTHTEWKCDLKGDSRDGLDHPAICYSPAQIPEHPKKWHNLLFLSENSSWNFNACVHKTESIIWTNQSLTFVGMELNSLRPRVGWSRPGLWCLLNQPLFPKWYILPCLLVFTTSVLPG